MNKKILCLAAGLGLAVTAAFATVGASSSLIKADDSDVEWRHYDAVKATATSVGSREYWVSCATREVVFTEPTGEHVKIVDKKTHESDYLTYLATQGNADARYTAYVPNAFNSTGEFWRYFRHGDANATANAGTVKIASNSTITYKLIQDAHELGIKALYFYATMTGSNATTAETITAAVVEAQSSTGKFSETSQPYYQVDVDDSYGFNVVLDVENWYTTFTGDKSIENATAFTISGRNSDNAGVSITSMSFSNLNCFDTLEAAYAYKANADLTNMFNTNGYKYFTYGTLPTRDGTKFVFTGNGGNLGITMKLVKDVKAAGKTKVSFNVKIATTEEGKNLNTAVWVTAARGTNANGDTLDWNTDWSTPSSDALATEGVTMTLNVSKLFGDNVTGNTAYYLSSRLDTGTDYTGPEGCYTLTISDMRLE